MQLWPIEHFLTIFVISFGWVWCCFAVAPPKSDDKNGQEMFNWSEELHSERNNFLQNPYFNSARLTLSRAYKGPDNFWPKFINISHSAAAGLPLLGFLGRTPKHCAFSFSFIAAYILVWSIFPYLCTHDVNGTFKGKLTQPQSLCFTFCALFQTLLSNSKAQIENWILHGVYSLGLWELNFLPMPSLHKCIYSTETTTSGVYNHFMQIF